MTEYQLINSTQDLLDYLAQYPELWSAVPTAVRSNISDDATLVFRLMDLAIQRGYLSLVELSNMIDFQNCEEPVLDAYAAYMHLPVPSNNTLLQVGTHVIEDLITVEENVEVSHGLGTLDYDVVLLHAPTVQIFTYPDSEVAALYWNTFRDITSHGQSTIEVRRGTYSSQYVTDASAMPGHLLIKYVDITKAHYLKFSIWVDTVSTVQFAILGSTDVGSPTTLVSIQDFDGVEGAQNWYDAELLIDAGWETISLSLPPSSTIYVDDFYLYELQDIQQDRSVRTIKKYPNTVELTYDNSVSGESLLYDVLFTYKKDYLLAKRMICQEAHQLRALRYTQLGIVYWLRLLLNNNCTINYPGQAPSTGLFQFLSWDGAASNIANAQLFNSSFVADGLHSAGVTSITLVEPLWEAILDTTVITLDDGLTAWLTVDGDHAIGATSLTVLTTANAIADLTSGFSPDNISTRKMILCLATPSETTTLEFTITADLDELVKAFILAAITDYFLPFPSEFSSTVSITWVDNTQDWVAKT